VRTPRNATLLVRQVDAPLENKYLVADVFTVMLLPAQLALLLNNH
jgi:hypothetical protein